MFKREIAMKLLSALAVGLMLAGPVSAQEWLPLAEHADAWERFIAAYEAGDYATVLQELPPIAEHGDPRAQFLLGGIYRDGEGVLQNYAEAAKWYRLAAEQGMREAQFYLALMYAKGKGVPQNDVLAHMWWNIAGANGHTKGAELRDTIETRMTPEQIAEAQALARRCMASDYQDCD